jgi:uncharacterized protein with GYD domain
MAHYIALMKWTEQGIQNVKDTVTRVEQGTAAFEKVGARIVSVYWTQGRYDLVVTADFPNEETLTAAMLGLAKAGNIRSETMRAFTAEEMKRILAQVP